MKETITLKEILRCFELAFGLKVNFFKSSFGGIHVDQNWINTNAKMVNCTTMTILFVYLGLLVGANARK